MLSKKKIRVGFVMGQNCSCDTVKIIFHLVYVYDISDPMKISIHPLTSNTAVKSLSGFLLNAVSANWPTFPHALAELYHILKGLSLDYLIARNLPRNTATCLQQMPCPAVFVQFHLAVPLFQQHLEEVICCCHSLDICHPVNPSPKTNERGYGVDLDFCWHTLYTFHWSVKVKGLFWRLCNVIVLIWRSLQRTIFVVVEKQHELISLSLATGLVQCELVAELTLQDCGEEGGAKREG